ncbi:patatin-like phospholipase family protein (plasmid) [Haloferax mediterranei ATCC 33500]|uniref:Patatin n=1 Tax=Haloferax mediterranei (strain ATCC 33500 / DSM 1411 / JCM 8866 / NBRC 14739 / NCIMB 2177 / R-4) TaxID=523841 RepID=I3RBH0_HALMT|nr:patatin-like phospholipase family protein [Haloferax mediterranei]AFK21580.1 putative patatin-like phospholipase [Haloferax mediterranei ATCC 33500]AHZ24372.1 patatin [Haloferax mediterranei ATCC 33500]ELZ97110.1 putative patatin-like phospholipase [Haloferax mediterranei ATCC 33500]MDX5990146.1 patatin-like phospholipase family protein [Haloferax mediterranei ATCC 33500]QCQ76777.1 patatin-like phospholipase family protein [Haloferax mediterranei ATCC 33500]
MSETDSTKVAIACQGGGSHTAFTAGVLQELLREWNDEYELVGISGTSGGAFNALAVWYGLVTADAEHSIELLDALWGDLAADTIPDRITNDWVVGWHHMESNGYPFPQFSPYQLPGSQLGKNRIKRVLNRHIDFDSVPDLCGRETPELVVGTVNINAGEFETFTNEDVTPEAVLASAAVPNLFEAVEINGHYHWDGLFSQNPPISDLVVADVERKPEELWVIQINPQTRAEEPTSLEEIADRRNELSGNISLNQELRAVERVNEWIDEGHLSKSDFKKIETHRIQMGREYHCSTKVDRSPAFLQELMDLGEQRASEFQASK